MKSSTNMDLIVRAALLCVACDIPAARKVCGFVGHQALRGCSKCLKEFPTEEFGEKADYSGFDQSNWKMRDKIHHHYNAMKHHDATSQKE